MGYDYENLCNDINMLVKKFKSISVRTIGKSVMGRNLYCLKSGRGSKKLLLLGAYHGLEYLTAAFVMRFMSDYTESVHSDKKYFGYDSAVLFDNVTVYAIPMVNPDGVDIAVNGLDITNSYHRSIISMAGIHSFNDVWQANAHGVDLNHNHNASWSMVVESPSPSKFGGEFPESEPESRAVADFVRKTDIDVLLSFHSQGKEIYYDFEGFIPEGTLKLAKRMAQESGYALSVPQGSAAFGGCKDWFIAEFGKPGFTVEIGVGKNPLPIEQLDDVYEENAKMILCTMADE